MWHLGFEGPPCLSLSWSHSCSITLVNSIQGQTQRGRRGKNVLLEAVPENTCRILYDSDIGCDVGLVVLHQRNALALPGFAEEVSEVVESRETPVALIGRESVRSSCIRTQQQCQTSPKEASLTMMDVNGGVFDAGQHQRKLHTGIPILRRFAFPGMFKVEGGVLGMITVREEENAPVAVSVQHHVEPDDVTHQGNPPHLKTGPCSFRSDFLQPSMCHVWCVSSSVSRSDILGRIRSIIAASKIHRTSVSQVPKESWPEQRRCQRHRAPSTLSSTVYTHPHQDPVGSRHWRLVPGWRRGEKAIKGNIRSAAEGAGSGSSEPERETTTTSVFSSLGY